jgi:hypothetical protein
MQEVLFVSSRARKLADTLIVVLAIFLALHQYAPTRALTLVALRRDRSCLLAKIMDGDRGARRQIVRRADKTGEDVSQRCWIDSSAGGDAASVEAASAACRPNLVQSRHEAPEIQPTLVLRPGLYFGLQPWTV